MSLLLLFQSEPVVFEGYSIELSAYGDTILAASAYAAVAHLDAHGITGLTPDVYWPTNESLDAHGETHIAGNAHGETGIDFDVFED